MPGPYDPAQTCLGIPELANWLHITERHVRRFVAERRIPFHKIGGRVRFVPSEITAWLDDNWHEAHTSGHGVSGIAFDATFRPSARRP